MASSQERPIAATTSTSHVVAVCRAPTHDFSKTVVDAVELMAGVGVAGDAHAGTTVKHRSRVAKDPTQPNLRQVHLLQQELFTELAADGFAIGPGDLGENITTAGLDLLALPAGTILAIGTNAVIEVTGLRNPCWQIDHFRRGVRSKVLLKTSSGQEIRKAGVMGIVVTGGRVVAGDRIRIHWPAPPHRPLGLV
jgi:MOSC domain-containing protein YiiM